MPTDTEPLRPDNALGSLPTWWLNAKLGDIEKSTEKDVLLIYGNIVPDMDMRVRLAIEALEDSRKKELLVILHTDGGVVEEVQNIVNILRHHYAVVDFFVAPCLLYLATKSTWIIFLDWARLTRNFLMAIVVFRLFHICANTRT